MGPTWKFKSTTFILFIIIFTLFVITLTLVDGQGIPAKQGKNGGGGGKNGRSTKKSGGMGKKSKAGNRTSPVTRVNYSLFEDEGRFCNAPSNRNFYRSKLDGAVCCRNQIIQAATILPEISGECAISTKTDANGMLDSAPLWCAYVCSLKKMGLMDDKGKIKPTPFFNHLSRALGVKTKENLELLMTKHFQCMTPFKNDKFPCYTPLGFHKCYVDALEYLCTTGMPKDNDFSKIHPSKNDYSYLQPTCETNGRQVMPSCCHGKPLPWTIPDLIEAPRNISAMKSCLSNMQHHICSATCYMNSAGVVDDSMEVNVEAFNENILGLFPTVQPSIWMNFLGPTYVFFDETLDEMSARISTAFRVCLFHDKILNFHEDKVQEYCDMNAEEVKEIKDMKETKK